MTRLETLIKDISDPSVAEALKLLGGSPTPGSGEPADSFEEVATGLRDANGHMIFKKSYVGKTTSTMTLVDGDITTTTHSYIDVKGCIELLVDGHTLQVPLNSGSNGNFINAVFIRDDGVHIHCEGHQALRENRDFYLTLYYTYKSVN